METFPTRKAHGFVPPRQLAEDGRPAGCQACMNTAQWNGSNQAGLQSPGCMECEAHRYGFEAVALQSTFCGIIWKKHWLQGSASYI